jgi:hypothetical protein
MRIDTRAKKFINFVYTCIFYMIDRISIHFVSNMYIFGLEQKKLKVKKLRR